MIKHGKYTIKIEQGLPKKLVENMSIHDRKMLYMINGNIEVKENIGVYKAIMVCYLEEEPVAFCNYDVRAYTGKMVLDRLYVSKDHRGNGIVKKMCESIEDMSSDIHWHAWLVNVYESNTEAIKTYESWGYKKIGKSLRLFDHKGKPHFNYQFYKMR